MKIRYIIERCSNDKEFYTVFSRTVKSYGMKNCTQCKEYYQSYHCRVYLCGINGIGYLMLNEDLKE